MKKIGILTINDDRNYGNRLQNFAVQQLFKNLGFEVETIHNKKNEVGIKRVKKIIKNIIMKFLFFNKKCKRHNSFMKFNKKIIYSKFFIDKNTIPKKLNDYYDYFFTGSDQVWNPNFGRMSDIDFLYFADKKKRNSLSASFGIDSIPDELKKYYYSRLIEMNNISVREEEGKKIVEELTGRNDVEVLIDPTMMLTGKSWNLISKKPKQMSRIKGERYILNYFLGGLSEKREKEINRIAEENNCEIINLLNKNDPFYSCGPSEFLYLEENAFLICTDSFHSSVFAILFDRPFIVFDREKKVVKSMNSRLTTLIKKFKLKNRKFNGKYITAENLKHDYTEAFKILEKERAKTIRYLKKSLNMKEE